MNSVYSNPEWLEANANNRLATDQAELCAPANPLWKYLIIWGLLPATPFMVLMLATDLGHLRTPLTLLVILVAWPTLAIVLARTSQWIDQQVTSRRKAEDSVIRTTGKVVCLDPVEIKMAEYNRRYIIEIEEGRQLKADMRLNLAPGEYEIFYLRRAGVLLSARPLHTPTPAAGRPSPARSAQTVTNTMPNSTGASSDDVLANRMGEFSEQQRAAIRKTAILSSLTAGGFIILGLVMLVAGLFSLSTSIEGLNVLFVAVGAIGYGIVKAPPAYQSWLDLKIGKPVIFEGQVEVEVKQSSSRHASGMYFYFLKFNNQLYSIDKSIYDNLVRDQHYRVCAARGGKVLSIEPLPDQD